MIRISKESEKVSTIYTVIMQLPVEKQFTFQMVNIKNNCALTLRSYPSVVPRTSAVLASSVSIPVSRQASNVSPEVSASQRHASPYYDHVYIPMTLLISVDGYDVH